MPCEYRSGIHRPHSRYRSTAHAGTAGNHHRSICRVRPRRSAGRSLIPDEQIRPTANGTDQGIAGSSTSSIIPALGATTSKPIALIGSTVETRLALELDRLRSDETCLDDFSPSLQGFVLHGHRLALASLLPEMTRLEVALEQACSDRDRYYRAAFAPAATYKSGPSYAEIQATRHAIYNGGTE